MVTPKRLLTLILIFLVLAVSACGTGGLSLMPPRCNGDFRDLIPKGWTFISQTPLDTDGSGPAECVVLYSFDLQTQDGAKRTPAGGVVYRQDHGKPRWMFPHPLNPPDKFYLGENQVKPRVENVLSGSPEPELLIEDKDSQGTLVQVSLFGWHDTKKDQPETDPTSKLEVMGYQPLGLFQGDAGVTVEKDKITTIVRRKDSRSQLAYRRVYAPREGNKSYYNSEGDKLPDPIENETVCLNLGDDPTASPYPEKTVMAFYQRIKDDAKLESLMTKEAFEQIKGGKLAYGCSPDRSQLERVFIQTVNWNAGTDDQPLVTVGGKCKHRDGLKDMPVTTWLFEKNSEGKWRLKGVAQ